MTIEGKIRIDHVGLDAVVAGSFIVNGSFCPPEGVDPTTLLSLGRTYGVTFGDEVSDPIPTPEPGTEANPPPATPAEPGDAPAGVGDVPPANPSSATPAVQ